MNIILFDPDEMDRAALPVSDRRARHIDQVLGLKEGDSFTMGVLGGGRGQGRLVRRDPDGFLHFSFELTAEAPPLYPVTLVVGLPRPQMAKRILRDATTLGVRRIVFFTTERGSKSYAQSPVFQPATMHELLREGAEQAVSTRLPEVALASYLKAALALACAPEDLCVACDNDEPAMALTAFAGGLSMRPAQNLVAVIGAERGFSHAERALLRLHGCTLVSLGDRVLRTDTACITALSLLLAGAGHLG